VREFEIIPATGEEVVNGDLTPEELVKSLALQKANEVAQRNEATGKVVLGADTVVALGNEVLGKPKDESDAFRMLSALSGKTHEVYTGVCISYENADGVRKEKVASACTKVRFFALTDEQIRAYIATGSPMDKAGAYGIQDGGLVEAIDGSFSNVVGLPVELCKQMAREIEENNR
jgi:septum formation protein